MSLTISNIPGDGSFIATTQLPDSGSSIIVTGAFNPGPFAVTFTGSPLTAPSAPGSGIINWLIEANQTTGALDVLQNTTPGTFPTNTTGCVTIFQQTLAVGNTDEALVATNVTPDV